MAYKFDEKKYKAIFDEAYGKGAYEAGMAQARKIGTTTVQAEFAKRLYEQRLREVERAAARARYSGYGSGGGSGSGSKSDDLVEQFRKEKQKSAKTGLDLYYENESKKLNKGRSKAMKKVEDIYPGVIPSVRDNKNLTDWAKMKLMGG